MTNEEARKVLRTMLIGRTYTRDGNPDGEARDALCKAIEALGNETANDTVTVVRCKECRFNRGDNKCLHPDSIIKIPADDDYCSYGVPKKKDDEIRVGDEVEYGRMVYVVTKITGDESHVLVIHTSGDVGAIPIDECHKTGRHFPEIAEVLKKMEDWE